MAKWRIEDPRRPGMPLCPKPYQRAFACSDSFATLMSGGWGSGKSYAGLLFILVSMARGGPGSIGLVILPTYPQITKWMREQFQPTFRHVIRAYNKQEKIITMPGGRLIYLQSATDPESVQVTSVNWLYADEPHLMPPEIWHHMVGRVRGPKGVKRRIGLTSLPRIGWLSELFHRPEYEGQGTPRRRLLYAETAWNTDLDQEYLEELKASCPARMLDAYLKGRFVAAGGSVWPELSESKHVIPWRYETQLQHSDGYLVTTGITVSVDWSPRVPHVQFWHRVPAGVRLPSGEVSPNDFAVLVDELYPDGLMQAVTTERLGMMIRARERERGYRIDRAVCDPAGKAAQSTSGESDMIILQRVLNRSLATTQREKAAEALRPGVRIVGVPHPVSVGISHVQWALEPLVGMPRIYIARDLVDHPYDPRRVERSTFKALQAYSYKEVRKGKPVDREPDKDGVADHAADCVRYFVYDAWPQDRLAVDIREVA